MTAVIYARYSSDNQREESIEGQIRECTAYAEKNGITVVKHYIDRALSAKTDNRPDFQQMIKDSEKRLFDIVLVWKLDRFARNRYDSAHYEYQLDMIPLQLVLIVGRIIAVPGKAVELPDQHDIKQPFLAVLDHLLEIRAVVGFCGKGAVNVVFDHGAYL